MADQADQSLQTIAHGFNLHLPHSFQANTYRPIPNPTGKYPYHLQLAEIIGSAAVQNITQQNKLVFQVTGDVGGNLDNTPQKQVATGLLQEFLNQDQDNTPAFLYILGDCVYLNGDIHAYQHQFYEPYADYPAPIFAIPGNHDGDNLPGNASLDGFIRNFCATQPSILEEAAETGRKAMIQPNVYWVLNTPLVNILGLYSNVPDGGDIRTEQFDWLVSQLKTLPRSLPLILTLHHAVFSADEHHSGSFEMKQTLEAAFQQAQRQPDMILAGHVHNYQRLSQVLEGGKQFLPYLICGAGGFHSLHQVKKHHGKKLSVPTQITHAEDTLILENYADEQHGFLNLEITADLITGHYYTVNPAVQPPGNPNKLLDCFQFDWKAKRYIS